MKVPYLKYIFLLIVLFSQSLYGQKRFIYQDNAKFVKQKVNNICRKMTLEEKASFLSGEDDWHFKGIERLGIPPMQVTDCGHGVTIVFDDQGNWVGNASCFPTAVGQAATWNRSLIRTVGSAIAREARATGSSILLAPMVNIKRTPLNGRNYETFSEDPLLTGEMAAAFIQGVQSESIGAVIKGLAANNQQMYQEELNVKADERALQEIYLRGFRIAVKKAEPWGIMTSYNGLNGERTSASKHLLMEIVKRDWKYKGFIVSDWRAVKSTKSISAGLDIEMPGPGKFMTQANILKAIEEKAISKKDLDDKIKRILRAYVRSSIPDVNISRSKADINTEKHQDLTCKVAEESIILLKNSNNLLPFDLFKIKKLAVIGPNASIARLGGGGSASVSPFYTVSPLDGLRKLCAGKTEIVYEEGCGLSGNLKVIDARYLQNNDHSTIKSGLQAEYFTNRDLKGEPALNTVDHQLNFSWGWSNPKPEISRNGYSVRWSGQIIPPVSGIYKLGISAAECGYRLYVNGKLEFDQWLTGGKDNFESHFTVSSRHIEVAMEAGKPVDVKVEFYKRMNRNFIRLEWEIPGNNSIEAARELAKGSDAVVIFAGLSNFFEGGNNDRKDILLPGDQNKLISQIARTNPNTVVVLVNGSPIGMPWINEVKAVLEAYYPGQEGGNAIANVLFGKVCPSGKLPETFPVKLSDNPAYRNYPGVNNEVDYAEGFYVGYRHYDTKAIEPLFPFGHGLSYTQFSYDHLKIKAQRKSHTVTFNIKNTGGFDGAEVAQLYLRAVGSTEDRPYKELKNFEKIFLKKGESKVVSFVIQKEDLAIFSKNKNKWLVEPGIFEVLVGSSSRDIRLKDSFVIH